MSEYFLELIVHWKGSLIVITAYYECQVYYGDEIEIFVKPEALQHCYFFVLDLMQMYVTWQMERSEIQLDELGFVFNTLPQPPSKS